MPYAEIGREVTRGTVCRDRWRAEVVVACSDRVPVGRPAPLAVRVRWRASTGEADASNRPEDSVPIVLRLRKVSEASTGSIRFDRAEGPMELELVGDTESLLNLYGLSDTGAEESDVLLEVSIEGEVLQSIPLSVGEPDRRAMIAARRGLGSPPDLIPPAEPVALRVVVTPPSPGELKWLALGGDALIIEGGSTEPRVTLVGREGGRGDRAICVVHTPEDGSAATMAAHRLAVRAGVTPDPPESISRVPEPEVVAAGWSTGLAGSGSVVELIAVVDGGVEGQRITFEIATAPAVGSRSLERIDVPLGAEPVVRAEWRVPEAIPGEDVHSLGFTVRIHGEPTSSADHQHLPGLPDVLLYGELQLMADLELTLTDSLGDPLDGVAYELRYPDGDEVEGGSGTTGPDGEISIPTLLSEGYTLMLRGVVVLDASEDEPAVLPPSPENTIFSLVDVRLDASEEEQG